ncbi:MAG: HD domain-containing protein [Candidatus Magasanikbacteria bacterium]|nr:HD domain-containing protein [Candidatus Magasanikbacteria bacterium]
MKYFDRVYGNFDITEPVILALINSPTLQRLKEIDQAGYGEPFFPGPARSRFEHSVGVCLLLRRYGASTSEQIAGLIHDVSHAAFSHCIDYVLDEGSEREQSHQDNIFDDYVRKTDIPEILRQHNFSVEDILDDRNFPLKEKELPDLCADRIDYSLRDLVVFNKISDAQYFLDNLIAQDGQWIFLDLASAKKYAELFLKLNTDYYTSFLSAIMYRTVGDYLRFALEKRYISESDLYTTDRAVLTKIKPFHQTDGRLLLLFERMNNKVGCRPDPTAYDAQVFCKSRVVDPLCWHEGEKKRLSDLVPEWVEILRQESKPKEYFLKFYA